jgi:hypothetical protein
MSSVTHTFANLIAWLAVRAGAKIGPAGRSPVPLVIAIPGAVVLGQTVGPNRAGRLVPMPEDSLKPEVGRSLAAHWALWGAVALIVLLLCAGYLRRRWKAAPRAPRLHWPAWGRDHGRK